MNLRVKADCNNNSKDNRRFYDVDPQCSLRESQNNIRFRHGSPRKTLGRYKSYYQKWVLLFVITIEDRSEFLFGIRTI